MGWEPKVKFEEVVEIMVDADLQEQSYKKGLMND
jgi:GDP-D-mannose dehydratase